MFLVQSRPYAQAVELQALIMRDARDEDTTPAARAQLARAWQVLEDQKREMRGKPKSGSLKPERKVKSKAKPLPPITEEPL